MRKRGTVLISVRAMYFLPFIKMFLVDRKQKLKRNAKSEFNIPEFSRSTREIRSTLYKFIQNTTGRDYTFKSGASMNFNTALDMYTQKIHTGSGENFNFCRFISMPDVAAVAQRPLSGARGSFLGDYEFK